MKAIVKRVCLFELLLDLRVQGCYLALTGQGLVISATLTR